MPTAPLKGLNWDPLKEQIDALMRVWGCFFVTVHLSYLLGTLGRISCPEEQVPKVDGFLQK